MTVTARATICPDHVPWCAQHIENCSGEQGGYLHRSTPVRVGADYHAFAQLELIGYRGRHAPHHPAWVSVVGGTLTPAEARQLAAQIVELANVAESDKAW